VAVYDILNAGPQQRFTVSGRLCHNCGFGMGPRKFEETARKYGLAVGAGEAFDLVHGWRADNPEVVSLWREVEDAARRALFHPGTIQSAAGGRLAFQAIGAGQGTTLTLRLPSGRNLYYRNTRIEPGKYSSGELAYDGIDQVRRQWTALRTWGGKLVENAVQATARDVLCEALVRLDERRLGDLVLSVHDEIIVEIPEDGLEGPVADEIGQEIERSPAFAHDLPVGAEGGLRRSYGI